MAPDPLMLFLLAAVAIILAALLIARIDRD
jgi:hypothetical protein